MEEGRPVPQQHGEPNEQHGEGQSGEICMIVFAFDQVGTLMKTWSMVNIIGVNPSVFISSFTSVLYFSFSRMTFTIAGVWNAWREPDAANAEHAERSWIDQL